MATVSSRNFIVGLAILNLIFVALGTVGASNGFSLLGLDRSMAFLSLMAAAIGILTFFGFLWFISTLNNGALPDQGLRTSITIAVVTVYLVIVGEVAFFAKSIELSEITNQMLTSFTSIVGVVVAFFFGASAYVEGQKIRKDGK